MSTVSPKRNGPSAQTFGYLARLLAPVVVFLGLLTLYTATLSPGLLPADAGEYQLVGATLGVAHPPGYALYTLLSWLFTRWLFFMPPARAINFESAVLAALTLGLLARAVQRLTRSHLAGYGAALALGFSTTFWAQAVTANIRMPSVFAITLAFERLVHYRKALTPRAFGWVALALGLSVSHHGSLVFIAAVLGLYALGLKPAMLRRAGIWPWVLGALPFLAWLYFPLRADLQPALATFNGFLDQVLARGFRGDILFFATLKDLPDRWLILGNILTFEFAWPLLVWGALGVVAAFWRDRAIGAVVSAAFAVHVFIAMTYRAPQTVEYLLPAFMLLAVFWGFALAELLRWVAWLARRRPVAAWPARLAALGISALLLGWQFGATWPSYQALASDVSTRAYATSVLTSVPPQALLLASWHWSTPLWYLQRVEQLRPDVEIRYVYPHGESLAQNWADEIRTELPNRPVVVTSFYAPEYGALPVRFLPCGPAWLVQAEPLTQPPPNLAGAKAFGAWTFLGYDLEPLSQPATTIELAAAWQTSGAPQDIAFFMHLRDAAGETYGQMDVNYAASRYQSGEVLLNRYRLVIRPETPPGDYTLVAGVYRPDGTRLAETSLTTLTLAQPRTFVAAPPPPAVPLGDSIYFLNADLQPAGPVHPGQTLTVDLHFLATRPLVADEVVKVDLIGIDGSWHVQHDGTPVGGAIPTLKWIAGSRLTDRHTLIIPIDATPGPAQLVLALYDSFTQQDVPILDPQLAAQGVTVPLQTVEVVRP
jgi:hypothetical protein